MASSWQWMNYYRARIISLIIATIYVVFAFKVRDMFTVRLVVACIVYLMISLYQIWYGYEHERNSWSRPWSELCQYGGVPYKKGAGLAVVFAGWLMLLIPPPFMLCLMFLF